VLLDANARRKEVSADLIAKATQQAAEVYGAQCPAGVVLAGQSAVAAHELGHIVADEMGLPAHRATRESGRRTPEVEDEGSAVGALGICGLLGHGYRRVLVRFWAAARPWERRV
jgi:hypothetical protein